MQAFEDFMKNVLNDVRVDLTDEFDRNFERKAFFDQPWPATKWNNNKGSLMNRTGTLRGSIESRIQGENIVWSSSLPYAEIQNDGGIITVTVAMKKFFWAMYYKASGAVTKGNNQRNIKLTAEAQIWKSLALMKVGQKMKIPMRKFIGHHAQVDASVERVIKSMSYDLSLDIGNKLKP